jgi:hypothetical protein
LALLASSAVRGSLKEIFRVPLDGCEGYFGEEMVERVYCFLLLYGELLLLT